MFYPFYFHIYFSIIFFMLFSSIHSCPSAINLKPCFCTSSVGPEKSRWVNVTCLHGRSWKEIRDALHPFRRNERFLIQTLYVEKIPDRGGTEANKLSGTFRGIRLAELIIADSVMNNANGKLPKGTFRVASSITSLHLHNVGLKTVPTPALRHLSILNQLSLASNSITSIPSGAFRHQSNSLKYLDLQRNQLSSIPTSALKSLQHLEILLLNGNKIHQILANAFQSIPNLEALELSDNEITYIHEHAFTGLYGLKHLGLAGNPLFSGKYSAIQNIPSPNGLLSLDISDTGIDLTENRYSSNSTNNLTSLVIQHHFQPFPVDLLSFYTNLIDLDMKGNTELDSDQFQKSSPLTNILRIDLTETALTLDHLRLFPTVRVVYMNSVKAHRLKQIHLTPLRSLTIFQLSDCGLRYMEMSTFWHLRSSIREMDFSHNRLRRLKRRTFHGLSVLEKIDLSYNRFRDYAKTLNENDQKSIFPLDKRFFDRISSKNLTTLSLAGNGLRRIPGKCLASLRRLKNLDLSGNRMENIQLQLESNVDLEILNLQNNKISYIHPEAFRNLKKLRILNLSWNQLTVINSIYFPITLQELNVARCFLNQLKNQYLANLNRLRMVDLSYNMIETISDGLFSGRSLIYVDLSMNPLRCDCQLQPFVEWASSNRVILSWDTICFWPIHVRYVRPFQASTCWSHCNANGTEQSGMCRGLDTTTAK